MRSYWIGLFYIVALYSLMYLFFLDAPGTAHLPRNIRHVVLFASLILVYGVGTIHLRIQKPAWMGTIWHFIHIAGISFLLLSGIIDWLIYPLPYKFKLMLRQVHEFLIAPSLYIIMGLLKQKMGEFGNEGKNV